MNKIKDEIFARMDVISPAEKKVARLLLASYPSAGLTSAAALAKSAGTSTPTVLRLVTRLGISSYAEFQKRLRDEITHQMSSPVSRVQHRSTRRFDSDVLDAAIAQRVALVERLASTIPVSEFDKAVRLLSCNPRSVLISGGYFSRHIAGILALQLDQIMRNIEFVNEPLGKDTSRYLDMQKDSVAIVFDFRRHELAAEQVSRLAKKRGASVILLTDEGLSPSAEYADVVLPVAVDGLPFDSFAGLLVLIECLVEAISAARGAAGLKRMQEWEETVQIHRVFRTTSETLLVEGSTNSNSGGQPNG